MACPLVCCCKTNGSDDSHVSVFSTAFCLVGGDKVGKVADGMGRGRRQVQGSGRTSRADHQSRRWPLLAGGTGVPSFLRLPLRSLQQTLPSPWSTQISPGQCNQLLFYLNMLCCLCFLITAKIRSKMADLLGIGGEV